MATLNVTAFSNVLREWRRCHYELKKLQGWNPLKCPACNDGMHACHVDGNKKLYRFKGRNQLVHVVILTIN